jgi:hypothetical protein
MEGALSEISCAIQVSLAVSRKYSAADVGHGCGARSRVLLKRGGCTFATAEMVSGVGGTCAGGGHGGRLRRHSRAAQHGRSY